MRTARRSKQIMYYSNFHNSEPIYLRDDEGNIVYRTMPDGEQVAVKDGETKEGYDEPTKFENTISGSLSQEELQAFGGETRAIAKITYHKEEYPFRVGTLIWKNSKVEHIDDRVDENSADYRVMGILNDGQHFYRAIMEKVTKGEGV